MIADAHSPVVDDVLSFNYVKQEKAGLTITQALSPPAAVLWAALTTRLETGRMISAAMLGALMYETVVDELPDAKELTNHRVRVAVDGVT